MNSKIRVLVVDDHPIFRDGVVRTLEENDFDIAGQAVSADDAVHQTHTLNPDIILLDIRIPGGGIACAQNITEMYPTTKIIILTGSDDEVNLLNALKAGARGYILKGVSGSELINIIHSVVAGDIYVTPSLAGSLLVAEFGPRREDGVPKRLLDGLTEREQQILEYVAAGHSNREIGEKLYLSENTIKQYMSRVMSKLHVRNRLEAALLVQQQVKVK
jgi:DNA-binding NarL/FixJ family response regulator